MLQLLDFYADWCGPCKVMEPIFADLEKVYGEKVEFKRVDVEAEGEVAGKYNVTSIPTFVLVKDDKEVARRSGATSKEVMKTWIDGYVK